MVPSSGKPPARKVSVNATIAEIAPLFGKGVDRLDVTDADGASAGVLLRDDVVAMMLRG